jgi:hypothetical protein
MEIKTPWLKNKATGIVSVKAPVGDTRTVSGNPVSIDNPSGLTALTGLNVDIEPVQDLNGYDHPWVGGAGKNKLPNPYGDGASKTTNGITYTVNADGSVTANGTATANNVFYLVSASASALANKGIASGTYVLSGAPSTSTSSNYYIQAQINGDTWVTATASGATINYNATAGGNDLIRLYVVSGAVLNNVTFKPMLRLASVTDATYEPYENICPITGHESASVNVSEMGGVFEQGGILDSTGADTASEIRIRTDFMECTASEITVGVNANEANLRLRRVYCYDASKAYLGTWDGAYPGAFPQTGTVLNGTKYIRLVAQWYNSAQPITPNGRIGIVNYSTYTIDLNGTRYGGTLNVLTGVLTVDRAMWNNSNWWTLDTAHGRAFRVMPHAQAPTADDVPYEKIKCSHLKTIAQTVLYNQQKQGIAMSSGGALQIHVDGITTVEGATSGDVVNWLTTNNVQIFFPLATPTTVQLTAQQVSLLTGTNIISTDMESLTVTTLNPDWQSLINPSSMKVSRYDLDAGETTGRNLEGYMLRDRQAVKEKIEMEFPPMYASDFHTMMELTKEQSFYVWYYSPYYGQWRAADMYVGDREGNLYYGYDSGHAPEQMWTDIKFNFIER